MNKKSLKFIGIGVTVIGFGLNLVQNYINENERRETIKEEISKQLDERSK